MTQLIDHSGPWRGSNGFRMMPTDPIAEAPAPATVTVLMHLQRS